MPSQRRRFRRPLALQVRAHHHVCRLHARAARAGATVPLLLERDRLDRPRPAGVRAAVANRVGGLSRHGWRQRAGGPQRCGRVGEKIARRTRSIDLRFVATQTRRQARFRATFNRVRALRGGV